MINIQEYLDNFGNLHMCKSCHYVLFAGNKNDRVLVDKCINNPPVGTKFSLCMRCA